MYCLQPLTIGYHLSFFTRLWLWLKVFFFGYELSEYAKRNYLRTTFSSIQIFNPRCILLPRQFDAKTVLLVQGQFKVHAKTKRKNSIFFSISFEVKDSMAKYIILLHVASTNTANYKNYHNITKTKLGFIWSDTSLC